MASSLVGNRDNGSDHSRADVLLFSFPSFLPHDVLGLDPRLPVFSLLQSEISGYSKKPAAFWERTLCGFALRDY